MARNTKKQAEATETEATPSQSAETAEAATEAVEINLDAFQQAVNTATEERDTSTGELPLAAIEPVNVAYRELDSVKAKNAAKSWLNTQLIEAIRKTTPDAIMARAISVIQDNLSAGTRTPSERKPVDPKGAYVNKLAAHRLAVSMVTSNVPDGVEFDEADTEASELADSLSEQVESYREWLDTEVPEGEDKPDAPEVSPVVRTAFKLAAGKASGGGRASGGSGVRRDIAAHIVSAFADLKSGEFLTVAQIASHTSEEYGNDKPSQGAVSARLFPTSGKPTTVPGVEAVAKTDNQPKGARKL